MKKSNIALIGFMGTGKTTVGEKLAKILKMDFIELDEFIEELAGKPIPLIFKEDGEIRFREYEIEACKKVSIKNNVVIACGGGVVLNKINIDYLKQKGIIIYLEATPVVIYERTMIEGKEKRPLLDNPNPMKSIKDLLEFRAPFYKAAAQYTINTEKDINSIINEIVEIFKKEKKNN
ncbi:MAG: shikimate kinase [Candidatus Helarchaeota archaeon]|nr:shikimate kinase [Candidatus Helarchaeota archaeon]